jgi:mannose-6-phosphate isomerase-like protein (cupin superfamily)
MSANDDQCGGDAPCWAHLFEDPEEGDAVDLATIALSATGRGPAWSQRSDDLDMNLLVFGMGEGVDEHVNDELDVLLVGVAGAGVVTIDGTPHPLAAGQAVVVPKGTRRGIRGYAERFAYLTCHRRRAGLWPTTRGTG